MPYLGVKSKSLAHEPTSKAAPVKRERDFTSFIGSVDYS